MTEDKLAEALAQYKQAIEEEVRCVLAYNQAKSEDHALTQAKKNCRDAEKVWRDLNEKFNKKNKKLLESVNDAYHMRREVENCIDSIIHNLIGENYEW